MSTYKLVIKGAILPGHEPDAVKTKIAALFKLTDKPQQLNALFSSKAVTVKKNLSQEQANKFVTAIKNAGLDCEAISENAPKQMPPPVAPVTAPTTAVRQPQPVPAAPQNGDDSGTEFNPYQQPTAALETQVEPNEFDLVDPQKLGASAGIDMLKEGFFYFKQNPVIWIATSLIFAAIMFVSSIIPIVSGIATYLLMPILVGGFMIACHKLYHGAEFEIGDMFTGFQTNTSSLLAVGGIYLLFMIVYFVIVFIVVFALMLGGAGGLNALDPEMLASVGPTMILLFVLIMIALSLPIMMATWFAPALIVINDVPAIEAMKLSFKGCLRNLVPFLIYGVVYLILAIIATIPILLGWLVLGPVILGSVYAGYRQIFTNAELEY